MSTQGLQILCVDDEPNILRALTRFLKMSGFEVSTAGSGQEALILFQTRHFDAVISDMGMPGMSGAELLSEVRRHWPKTSRFLLTGFSDLAAQDPTLDDAQLWGFIHKPWDNEALLACLHAALSVRD
jgi:response regulator RpfG family c-di-GMP phosphodiesterase